MIPHIVYIGTNQITIKRFNHLLKRSMRIASDIDTALDTLEHYRRKENVILFERTNLQQDKSQLSILRQKCPTTYIILITEPLSQPELRQYLAAGINNALSPENDETGFFKTFDWLNNHTFHVSRTGSSEEQAHPAYRIPTGKRLVDIVLSAGALLILSPILLIVTIAIRLEDPGPVIYKSKRVGSNYRIFDFLKFRSMYINADKRLKELNNLNQYTDPSAGSTPSGISQFSDDILLSDDLLLSDDTMLIADDFIIPEAEHISQVATEQKNAFVKLENDPRITRVGRFIRKYSIDELPQLFNILRGDMSIVGNRPLPLYEAEKLTDDEYIERFMCASGLTGLWQVEKRGHAGKLSPEERKQLDIEYARKASPILDLKIIIKTFTAFIQKENV